MTTADKAPAASGQRSSDLLVIGGGIMGLWAAVMAARGGLETVLVERDRLGAGASGGLLGALMPHMPDQWNDKKQFQFDALVTLEAEIERLEAETGLSAGYRRSGRIIPLPKPHLRDIAERRSADADAHWQGHGRSFSWMIKDRVDNDWPGPSALECGFVHETLAGRVAPRALLRVLQAAAMASGRVRIVEGQRVAALDAHGAVLANGDTVTFGHAIVAAGTQSFPILDGFLGPGHTASGTAVKGQAALLRANVDPQAPVVFLDGLYIVPHDDGTVAIGSTSENSFDDPFGTDHRLDALVSAARSLAPILAQARVVERWAGLRPKAIGRDPMIGPVPDHPSIVLMTGGFKVSFGLAHLLAKAAIDGILRQQQSLLPAVFTTAAHIELMARKNPA